MGIFSRIKHSVDQFIARAQKDAVTTWDDTAQLELRRGHTVRAFGAWSAMQAAKAGPRSTAQLAGDLAALSTGAVAIKALGAIPRGGQILAAGYEASAPLRRALHLKDMVERTTNPKIVGGSVYTTLSPGTISKALATAAPSTSAGLHKSTHKPSGHHKGGGHHKPGGHNKLAVLHKPGGGHNKIAITTQKHGIAKASHGIGSHTRHKIHTPHKTTHRPSGGHR